MNMFFRELKSYRKSLIYWCIGIFLFIAAAMAKYGASSLVSGQSMNDLISKMPKAVQSIFGGGTFDLSKAIGYFGVVFIYIILMAAIHSSMLGANIISKEEEEKTAEFLFVKPVSRINVITSKLLAALVNIVIFNIVTLLSSIVFVGHYSKGEAVTGDIMKLMLGMFILQLIFMSVGMALAAACKNPKIASSTATGIMLVTYVLSLALDINSRLENLKYFTPFKYFDAKNLLYGKGFEPIYLMLSAVIIAIFVISTYVFYDKRDLKM